MKFLTDLHPQLLALGGPLPLPCPYDASASCSLPVTTGPEIISAGQPRASPITPDQSEKDKRYQAEATVIEALLCVESSTKYFLLQWLFHSSQQLFMGGVITPLFGNEEKPTIRH